ncbi:MAG: hypothetical protein P1V97_06630, partial [Planctomycetota bacterium]|nr:hypothetical protein [Planctomycetota bacterium]
GAVKDIEQRVDKKKSRVGSSTGKGRKEEGGLPPAAPAALALLALAVARRRRLRFAPKAKRVGGVVYRDVMGKIRGALSFSSRDQSLRKDLSARGVGVAVRLATRLRFLPRPEGLLVYADALRDLGSRATANRFKKQSIRTAERLEDLATAIDKTLKIAVGSGNRDIAFLEQEKEFNKIIDSLEDERSRDVFFSEELLKVRGEDPRNRIVDFADPTANFMAGGVINYGIGYSKLALFAIADFTLGNLSRTDANISDFNEGKIDAEEYKSRELNGAVNDVAKLGITVVASSIQPAMKLSKLGKVGFSLAIELSEASSNLAVDAVTGKGRGELLTNGDLLKEGSAAVLNALLTPAGGVKLLRKAPQSAKRQLLGRFANEKVQDVVVGKLFDQAVSKKPKAVKEMARSR